MQECTTAPARRKNAGARGKPDPTTVGAPEIAMSPYDSIAAMGSQIEEGFGMLVNGEMFRDGSPIEVTIDFIRRHIRDALWNFASPDIHTINDGATSWFDQITLALEPVPSVLDVVLVAARGSQSPMTVNVLLDLKAKIEAMSLALTQWDAATLEYAYKEVTEDQPSMQPCVQASRAQQEPVTRESDFAIPPGLAADCLYDIAAETESILSVLMAALAKHANPDSCDLVAATALIRRLDQLNALVMSCASGAPDATFADAYKVLAPSLDNEVRALPPGPLSQRIWDYYGQGAAA